MSTTQEQTTEGDKLTDDSVMMETDRRKEEVQQIPELAYVVLQRCTSEDELAMCRVLLCQHHEEFAVLVLEPMTLINDHVGPFDRLQHSQVGSRHDHLVLNDEHSV